MDLNLCEVCEEQYFSDHGHAVLKIRTPICDPLFKPEQIITEEVKQNEEIVKDVIIKQPVVKKVDNEE